MDQAGKIPEQLPKLPTDDDNLDLYKDIDVDTKRFMSHRDVVESADAEADGPKTARMEHNTGQEGSKGFETERKGRNKSDRDAIALQPTKNARSVSKDQGSHK